MNSFKTLCAAAAVLFALPAFANEGLQVSDPYARSMGGIGASGAIFLQIANPTDADDRLVSAASDVADKVELHTHIAGADGVMQMIEVPEGFPVPAQEGHSLQRGGDHIMLMGLTRALKDGDMITVTLTFEKAGEVVVEVPVDNARKPDAMGMGMGMGHKHGNMPAAPSN